ncbi:AAA family ATPase [Streptomyces agglomeratus]|uniref:AAA family ATPase n=1 Tax=Streptomyces agglomeratus TaxID=285458 RepID=A0A1E5P641_9ACTN|nr:ATP-binding protein [Streptomyces agglomeratus]OEJ24989.1 AAA family ATPase [Streptomyces agglomeratus]OEJ53542.1 AAA family ATPase [Streptomyces agglomeratus]
MDPMNRGPEEHGHDNDRPAESGTGDGPRRPPRDALPPALAQSAESGRNSPGPTGPAGPGSPSGPGKSGGQSSSAPARTVRVVAGDFLLTVNPVDGSEIEVCPPAGRPERPVRHSADDRAELMRAATPPVPPGPPAPELPLLERQEERERLARLLARGRSVRLTGPSGSGRTALLDAVAADCADLAPDGVVRLCGAHRTPDELLHDLFAAVYSAPLHRPDRAGLLGLVHEIGAVVVVDDLEFGGAALDELLEATPECAFLLAATPGVPAPSPESHVEEVFLAGLGRGASLELLERAVDRPLTDDEANWAGDLWFESEGLPLRFTQAGALLRQRDRLRADPHAFEAHGYFHEQPIDAPFDAEDGPDVAMPSLAEGAMPAPLLASRLSESARATLRFALALGGEVPHQAHLPALVGDTHADAALGELMSCGLLSPVGARFRLAAGVAVQLEAAGFADDAPEQAHTAAQHYAWWAGHPSVTPERAAAEADAILAAMGALVPGTEAGHASAAVLLARTAAPAFAAGLCWGAWERALRTGLEAARIAGEVAEEAYFHHELGVLALCTGNLDRARAELEASVAMRGAVADKSGTVAGRRALALVADRAAAGAGAGALVLGGRTPAGEEVPAARYEESASPPGGVPAAVVPLSLPGRPERPGDDSTLVTHRSPEAGGGRLAVLSGARRNMVAAGAGALLVAVLGTVVTLGATSDNEEPRNRVTSEQSANEDDTGDGLVADEPTQGSTKRPVDPDRPSGPGTSGQPRPGSGGGGGAAGEEPSKSGRPTDDDASSPGSRPPASDDPTTGGPTTGGPTTSGGTTGGPTTGGPTTGGPTTGGPTTGGPTTSGGTTDGGTTDGGTTDGGTMDGGTTDGGTTDGGTTDGGSTDGGATGGTTSGAEGGTTEGSTADGGTTTSGSGPSDSAPAASSASGTTSSA